jgi:hypothetical protein
MTGNEQGQRQNNNPPALCNTPRFRDPFLPLIHRPQAPFQYDLYEPHPPPKMGSEITPEKLPSLWGAAPTVEDSERSHA